ncbi:hypothetical protein BHE74_00033134 [Ensete ventricosum]|nr:hypothetical protein BHE74_00033134 [Ensete ventricosum]
MSETKSSDKELNDARGDLSNTRRQLKEAWVKVHSADDDLLKSVKEVESARAKLLRRVIDDYKGSTGFKEGLKRMDYVSYEYGYQVTLARFDSSRLLATKVSVIGVLIIAFRAPSWVVVRSLKLLCQ